LQVLIEIHFKAFIFFDGKIKIALTKRNLQGGKYKGFSFCFLFDLQIFAQKWFIFVNF